MSSSGGKNGRSINLNTGTNNSTKNNKNNMSAADKNATMSRERSFLTNLFESSQAGHTKKVINLIVEYSRDYNVSIEDVITQFKDGSGKNVLHFACSSGPTTSTTNNDEHKGGDESKEQNQEQNDDNEDLVIALLESKTLNLTPSICKKLANDCDTSGLTPLMITCQASKNWNKTFAINRIECILRATSFSSKSSSTPSSLSSILQIKSKAGATVIHYAASAPNPDILHYLLLSKNTILSSSSSNVPSNLLSSSGGGTSAGGRGGTPIHWAAAIPPPTDVSSTLAILIEYGNRSSTTTDSVNATDENGTPPIIMAAACGNDKTTSFLVRNGAEIGCILSGNVTLLHVCADLNLVGTLAAIVERGCGSSADDIDNNIVRLDDDTEVVTSCIERKNDLGERPIDLAAQEDNLGCFMLLSGIVDEKNAKEKMEELKLEWKEKKKKMDEEEKKKGNMSSSSLKKNSNPDNNIKCTDEDSAKEIGTQILSSSSVSDEDKALALQSKNTGNTYYTKKEYNDAILHYNIAIKYDPSIAAYWSNRSACHVALHKYNEALHDGTVARTLRPQWSKACYRMAVARLALGRCEDAALSAWEGLQMDQDNEELKSFMRKCVKVGRKEHFSGKVDSSRTTAENGEGEC